MKIASNSREVRVMAGVELPGVTDCLEFLSDRNFPFSADSLSRSVHARLIRMTDLLSRLFDY